MLCSHLNQHQFIPKLMQKVSICFNQIQKIRKRNMNTEHQSIQMDSLSISNQIPSQSTATINSHVECQWCKQLIPFKKIQFHEKKCQNEVECMYCKKRVQMRFINGHEKYCTLKIKNDRNEGRGEQAKQNKTEQDSGQMREQEQEPNYDEIQPLEDGSTEQLHQANRETEIVPQFQKFHLSESEKQANFFNSTEQAILSELREQQIKNEATMTLQNQYHSTKEDQKQYQQYLNKQSSLDYQEQQLIPHVINLGQYRWKTESMNQSEKQSTESKEQTESNSALPINEPADIDEWLKMRTHEYESILRSENMHDLTKKQEAPQQPSEQQNDRIKEQQYIASLYNRLQQHEQQPSIAESCRNEAMTDNDFVNSNQPISQLLQSQKLNQKQEDRKNG